MTNGHVKSVQETLLDLKDELKDFLSTRVAMLRAEMSEKLRIVKMAAPTLVVGLFLLLTAWFVFTGFLIVIIAQAFMPSPWAYTLSFVLVAVLYAIVGGAAAYMAWRRLKTMSLKPERTIRVLEQDRIWIQREAKTQV